MHRCSWSTGKCDRTGAVILRATACLRRGRIKEITADVAGVELDGVQARIHVEPGRICGGRCCVRVCSAVGAAVVPDYQDAGRARQEGESVLVHMHRAGRAAIRIAAGGIVPGCSCASCEPNVKSVDQNAMRGQVTLATPKGFASESAQREMSLKARNSRVASRVPE